MKNCCQVVSVEFVPIQPDWSDRGNLEYIEKLGRNDDPTCHFYYQKKYILLLSLLPISAYVACIPPESFKCCSLAFLSIATRNNFFRLTSVINRTRHLKCHFNFCGCKVYIFLNFDCEPWIFDLIGYQVPHATFFFQFIRNMLTVVCFISFQILRWNCKVWGRTSWTWIA